MNVNICSACLHDLTEHAGHDGCCTHEDCLCRGVDLLDAPVLRMTESEFRERLLRWRDVEDPCLKCTGSGRVLYSSTATWRGGIGGAAMTTDVCDACWGSGDRYRTGCDLRRLRDEESRRIAEGAAEALVRSCGGQISSARGAILEIVEVLDKFVDKRGAKRNLFTDVLSCGLRNILAKAIGMQERRDVR